MTLVVLLTIFSFAVVIGTRLRLHGGANGLLRLHTGAGLVGTLVWVVFLIAKPSTYVGGSFFGLIGLGLGWVVSVAGLGLAATARSGGGRRVASRTAGGARYAAVAVHVLVFVAWVWMTYAYATRKV